MRRSGLSLSHGVFSAFVFLFLISGVYAQSNGGAVAGSFLDSSGAAIVGASITATGLDTGRLSYAT